MEFTTEETNNKYKLYSMLDDKKCNGKLKNNRVRKVSSTGDRLQYYTWRSEWVSH